MTSSYAWLITHDSIADKDEPIGTNQNATGIVGPRDIGEDHKYTLLSVAKAGFNKYKGESVHKFKMYDDDGELYYTGLYIGPDEADLGEDAFGPLDDFGTPNAGCTEIRYYDRRKRKWDEL